MKTRDATKCMSICDGTVTYILYIIDYSVCHVWWVHTNINIYATPD